MGVVHRAADNEVGTFNLVIVTKLDADVFVFNALAAVLVLAVVGTNPNAIVVALVVANFTQAILHVVHFAAPLHQANRVQLRKAEDFCIFNRADGRGVYGACFVNLSSNFVKNIGGERHFISDRSCCSFGVFLYDFVGHALQSFSVFRSIACGLICSCNLDRSIAGNGSILNNCYSRIFGCSSGFAEFNVKRSAISFTFFAYITQDKL